MNSATSSNLYLFPSSDKRTQPVAASFPSSGEELFAYEQQAYAHGRALADDLVARMILNRHEDPAFVAQALRTARDKRSEPLRSKAPRQVVIQLMGGGDVTVTTPYLVPDRRRLPGRRRGIGRRGPKGSGCYPVLEALGISDRATPLVRSEVARSFVQSGSYEEARENLSRAGLTLNMKTLTRLAFSLAHDVTSRRDALLSKAMTAPLPEESVLEGRRVVIGTDGGKARLRKAHRRGRRRNNGRRGFVTEWKEPKGFVIYIIDEHGRIDRDYLPWSDTIMGDADAIFALLVAHLRLLGVHLAKDVAIIADGAHWIWDRMPELVRRCELDPAKVVEVLDFYHACNYLSQALDTCRGLSEQERRETYERLRGYLYKGQQAYLIAELRRLGRGRRARKMKNAIKYFTRHKNRTRYASYRRKRLPLGSGAMESMIRRVVNLRFKGPGIFWTREHIEPLLHLRSVLKTGRWDMTIIDLLRSQHEPAQQPPALAWAAA